MKGYISIDIPTSPKNKAYIIHLLGNDPIMKNSNLIGNKLNDLLAQKRNKYKTRFSNEFYSEIIRVYIPISVFVQKGHHLNETNIINFNIFIRELIRHRVYEIFDYLMEIIPVIEANIPEVRRKLGIDIDDWDDDSLRKDYYRYRLKKGKALQYNKKKS